MRLTAAFPLIPFNELKKHYTNLQVPGGADFRSARASSEQDPRAADHAEGRSEICPTCTEVSYRKTVTGLCDSCRHRRQILSDRGSAFIMCQLGLKDPHFPKYPRLPVLQCAGFADVLQEQGKPCPPPPQSAKEPPPNG